MPPQSSLPGRRTFLVQAATLTGSLLFASSFRAYAAETASNVKWRRQIGLMLGTIRDRLADLGKLRAALQEISALGIREVESTSGYDFNGLTPKEYRAMLDEFGLKMPCTHAVAVEGPDLEKTLEGFQIMGLEYARIGTSARDSGESAAPRAEAGKARANPPTSVEAMKRSAENQNRRGKMLQKFGMKNYIHNHTIEFEPIEEGRTNRHETMIRYTDPELVTMQLDVGWASVAGQDVVELFRRHPGRYELWHVKDAKNLKTMDPSLSPTQRQRLAQLCAVGEGDVDYKTIFAHADRAGLKHFTIEQDNAPKSKDSLAEVRTSYRNLVTKILV